MKNNLRLLRVNNNVERLFFAVYSSCKMYIQLYILSEALHFANHEGRPTNIVPDTLYVIWVK